MGTDEQTGKIMERGSLWLDRDGLIDNDTQGG